MAIFHDTTKAKKIFHDGVKIKQVFYDGVKVFNDGPDPTIYEGPAINYFETDYDIFSVFSSVSFSLGEIPSNAFAFSGTIDAPGGMINKYGVDIIISGNMCMVDSGLGFLFIEGYI